MRRSDCRSTLAVAALGIAFCACDHGPLHRPPADAASEAATVDAIAPVGDAPMTADAADEPAAVDAASISRPLDAQAAERPGPLPCESLRPLAERGVLGPWHALQALTALDGRTLVVRVTTDPVHSSPQTGDVYAIGLPDGTLSLLATGIVQAEWLGQSDHLLVELASSSALAVVPLAGSSLRTITGKTCDHLASPDGSRLLVIRDCYSERGVLDVVDVHTGIARTQAGTVLAHSLAMSPSGRLAAYKAVLPSPDGSAYYTGAIHVFDDNGDDHELAVAADADGPRFVTDDLLLFETGARHGVMDIYRYIPSRSTIELLAHDRDPGFHGFRVSADGSLVLAAIWGQTYAQANQLVAIHLDGSGETLLATDLYAYQQNQVGPSVFAFSSDGSHAIYIKDRLSQVLAAPASGGASLPIAAGAQFLVSPYADRVVTIESDRPDGPSALHVVRYSTAQEGPTVQASTALRGPTFVPGDRGLLYVEPSEGLYLLRFLSFSSWQSALLGQWKTSALPVLPLPMGELQPAYPVDRNGCFVVVDSDLGPDLGTRLVLLPD